MNYADHKNKSYQNALFNLQLNLDNDIGGRSLNNIKLHSCWINENILNSKKSNILDLGCGIGTYSKVLASLGHKVVAVDISQIMINYAKKNNNNKNITFICDNIINIEFINEFDLIIFPYSVINIFSKHEVSLIFKRVKRALKNHGIFYFEIIDFSMVNAISNQITRSPTIFHQLLYRNIDHISISSEWLDNKNIYKIKYQCILTNGEVKHDFLEYNQYHTSTIEKILQESNFNHTDFISSPPGTLDNDGLPYRSVLAYM